MSAKRSLPSVARSRRFQQALGKRLRVLDVNLPAALRQDVEALHRTRVASRRLREVLPILEAPGADQAPVRKTRGKVQRLTRALGGVRELDVALELLDELTAAGPELVDAAAPVRANILRDRAVRYADMIRSLDGIKPGRLAREVSAVVNSPDVSRGAALRRLADRVSRRSRRLDRVIEAAGSLYAFDRLHAVRIAVKKLRYSLELVREVASIGTTRLVIRLKEVQELLGRLHDLEILAGYVREAGTGSHAALRAGNDRLQELIDNETRRLHAAYLGRAAALRSVTDASRSIAAERL